MSTEESYRSLKDKMIVLAGRLGALEESVFSCCGITLAQCQTLVEIGQAGKLSLGELSARLSLDNSTLSRTVNNLVAKGLCEREDDPKDRRYVCIRLAGKGAELFRSVASSMDEWYEAIFEAIPEEKRPQVLESLEFMLEAVEKAGVCKGGQSCDE